MSKCNAWQKLYAVFSAFYDPMSRLVTVIPVYNGERFLEATLESVVSQTRRPDRVIIQDNCSTDGTHRIAKAFEKEGFEWRLTDEHVGSTENFNNALRYAEEADVLHFCLLYTSPSPRDQRGSRMPSSA